MNRFWWTLPGPGGFVDAVAASLQEGENAVLWLPRHLPDGLPQAVRAARFPDSADGLWEELEAAPTADASPARQVADRFLFPAPAGPVGASVLAHHDDFAGRVVWLRGITPADWPAWADFLAEYAHDVKARPLVDRCVFVAPLAAPPPGLAPPIKDVALAIHRWAGRVDALDQLIFVSRSVRDTRTPRLQKEVAVAAAAGLALWDPDAGCRLAARGLDHTLRPHDPLAALAAERGWAAVPENPEERWAEGLEDWFGGDTRLHSAVLALEARRGRAAAAGELERRIWEAQVGVLFPFVEQARRRLVEQLDGHLRGPFRVGNGAVVPSIRDLEIGQLHYYLIEQNRAIPAGLELLKDMRNRLAHLQTVTAETLRHPDLLDERLLTANGKAVK